MELLKTITQQEKYNKTSDRYNLIKTIDILDFLESKNFKVYKQTEVKTRLKEKEGFQKHLIQLFNSNFKLSSSEVIPMVFVKNSHDGKSALTLNLGLYRLVCSNGLVAGKSFSDFRVLHNKSFKETLTLALEKLEQMLPKLEMFLKNSSQIILSESKKIEFAQRVIQRVFENTGFQIRESSLLAVNRLADKRDDLFTVFNVVQENIIRGYFHYRKLNEDNESVVRRARAVKNIDKLVDYNQKIFDVTNEFASEILQ